MADQGIERLDELLEDEFQRSGARSFERRRSDEEALADLDGDEGDLVEAVFPGPVISGAIGDMRNLLATVLVRLDQLEDRVTHAAGGSTAADVDLSGITRALAEHVEHLDDRLDALESKVDRSARQSLRLRRSIDDLLTALGYTSTT